MNSAKYVREQMEKIKASGKDQSAQCWDLCALTVGWPYGFGQVGTECTPSRRTAISKSHPEPESIITKCQVLNGSGKENCNGCQWYPGGERVLLYDCQGFVKWILKQIYGWMPSGGGATSMWNTASNWREKGNVSDGIPKDTIVCLFYRSKTDSRKMAHTGLYYNGETYECSNGVQYKAKIDKKWEVWGVPACVSGEIPTPEPVPVTKPTLRKGSSGTYVTLLQTQLIQRGYSCGSKGADGKYGDCTVKAVKAFQADSGLKQDGITGPATWAALDSTEPTKHYTVTIPGLVLSVAQGLVAQYPNAIMKEE